ncbi:hypothetical protein AMIS_26440 [Actinoplanes missouriensis 431]|uniref:ABC3 transporter permease protein domain-containing protein n=1 Tax=Actinoplanes missouriensis (strain ATCC 14538 / DSM 43046 / CBS 188.64 / JCM 3121 / NBRC 102363 / NCIMB 12654 / NRRL B-3342 / UNCC 431) TaxID=512565 RepID=I0H4C7_ACTM4|nr:ABC transporter permease [Actinoplanes missouriensis]BAL87864.1 hypothetical protein AMIS_26440 [Actinoplanes missouriensis 431]
MLGLAGVTGYAAWQEWTPVLPLPAAAGGIGSAVAVGVLAGVYPAVRAARMAPVEALSAT